MKRIMVTGCGGYAAIGFTRCLKDSPEKFFFLGTDCDQRFISFGETDEKFLVPRGDSANYVEMVKKLVEEHSIDFIHAQPQPEIPYLSKSRDRLGAALFLPKHRTIETCDDKMLTNKALEKAGVPVPRSIIIKDEDGLGKAFADLEKPFWIRAVSGAGGKGSLLVDSLEQAKLWIESSKGWGNFMACEYLPGKNFGCDLVFKGGELVSSQTKLRLEYVLQKCSPSGITGTTGVLKCVSQDLINRQAEKAVLSVDPSPDGVFAVDMRENGRGESCVTEINAGRFLSSSVHLFHKSGVNLPYLYVKLAYDERPPEIKTLNPIPDGTLLVRQLDIEPMVLSWDDLEKLRKRRDGEGYAKL